MTEMVLKASALPASQDPARVYLSRLGPGSRRTMAGALRTLSELAGKPLEGFPWHQLRYQHCQAIRTALSADYAAATANKILSALKGVLKECWRLGLIGAEAYHRAVDIAPVKGSTVPRGRALPREELDRLFLSCRDDTGPTGCRDLAIFSVLYGAGLRRQEVARLGVEDYNPSTSCLLVRGKGTKQRTVYIKNGQRAALEAWLEVRSALGSRPLNDAVMGQGKCQNDRGLVKTKGEASSAGPLFLATGGKGRGLTTKGLSADAIYGICKARAEEAGIETFSPHDLRRTSISDMLDAGADISAVKAVAGHSKVDTTARYDRRGERAKEAAAGLLGVWG